MDYQKRLERIKDVYDHSVIFYHPDRDKTLPKTGINISSTHKNFLIEIDGNYLLFFNDIYTNTVSKILKNILKKLTWPILKRQVYFNSAIKQLLYSLTQESYDNSVMNKEVNQKITELEQKIEQLYEFEQKMETLSQLEKRIEQLSIELQANNSKTDSLISAEETKIKKD